MTTPKDEAGSEGPFGCANCWPATPEAALAASKALVRGEELIDDSHLGVHIRTCPQCRQRFVAVFLEHVDWSGGDDAQYWTLMPITPAESTELAGLTEAATVARLNALPGQRRCLQKDHPTGKSESLGWGSGMWIVS